MKAWKTFTVIALSIAALGMTEGCGKKKKKDEAAALAQKAAVPGQAPVAPLATQPEAPPSSTETPNDDPDGTVEGNNDGIAQ